MNIRSHVYALRRAKTARRCVQGSRDPNQRLYHMTRWRMWMAFARSLSHHPGVTT